MGGRVCVDSAPGKGSNFIVALPNVATSEHEQRPDKQASFDPRSVAFKNATVLIAGDV